MHSKTEAAHTLSLSLYLYERGANPRGGKKQKGVTHEVFVFFGFLKGSDRKLSTLSPYVPTLSTTEEKREELVFQGSIFIVT